MTSVLLISVLHWFPWRALLHRDLHRLEAYALGLTAILAPAMVVLWIRGDVESMILVGGCALAAGTTTAITKGIDLIAAYRNELQDRRNRD